MIFTSCDAEILYGSAEVPKQISSSNNVQSRNNNISFICNIYKLDKYIRRIPKFIYAHDQSYIEEWIRNFDQINKDYQIEMKSALFKINNAILLDDGLYTEEKNIIYGIQETFRSQDSEHLPLESSQIKIYRIDNLDINLYINSSSSFNYGHWLVEDLPRLKAFFFLRNIFPFNKINIIMQKHNPIIDNIRKQSIRLFLSSEKKFSIIEIEKNEAYKFKFLYYVTPIAIHPVVKSRDAIKYLSSTIRSKVWASRLRVRVKSLINNGLNRNRRKLFIDRQSEYGRNLTNREDIINLVSNLGFETIDPIFLNFENQVTAFADANVVIGIMGAAMTNTIFCSSGTSVVHLAAKNWNDPFFWDLSSVLNHHYHVIYGDNASNENPNREPFAIDIEQLERLIISL